VYCICSEFRISIVVDSVYEISCKVHRCQPIAFVGRSGRVLFSLINKTKTECLCNRWRLITNEVSRIWFLCALHFLWRSKE
jgi:hypothetical protein